MKELKRIRSPRAIFSSNYKNQLITDDIINSVMVIIIFFFREFFLYP